jgi:hypothetical protein
MSTGYLQVYRQQGFTSIGLVTKDNDGAPVAPDAGPVAAFFRINPADGTAAKDTAVGTLGDLTLAAVAGSPFLFQAGLDLSTALFEQYEVVISYSFGGGAGTAVQHLQLIVSNLDQIQFSSSGVTVAQPGTTFKAPTPTVP